MVPLGVRFRPPREGRSHWREWGRRFTVAYYTTKKSKRGERSAHFFRRCRRSYTRLADRGTCPVSYSAVLLGTAAAAISPPGARITELFPLSLLCSFLAILLLLLSLGNRKRERERRETPSLARLFQCRRRGASSRVLNERRQALIIA